MSHHNSITEANLHPLLARLVTRDKENFTCMTFRDVPLAEMRKNELQATVCFLGSLAYQSVEQEKRNREGRPRTFMGISLAEMTEDELRAVVCYLLGSWVIKEIHLPEWRNADA